jgi:fructose-bisphosphate aldolase class 1
VFKGNTDDINGHVFQCHIEASDKQQFSKTVEALAEYIAKNIKYAKDVASLCKTGKLAPITEPAADLSEKEKKSETKKMIWKAMVESFVQRMETRESSLQEIHAVIWGQCSITMQAKLCSLEGFDKGNDVWDRRI